jgi:uncharacterized protein YjbI with pentapeptide repeats
MATLPRLSNRQVLSLLMTMAFVSVFVSALSNSAHTDGDWFAGLFSNLGTEMIGAVLTYGLFEIILGGQEKEAATKTRKQELLLQMRSQDNERAREAIELIRHHGWLIDGSLHGANCEKTNWQEMDLREAHLEEMSLSGAKLQGTMFHKANLKGAKLGGANLHQANLLCADLREAIMIYADLQEANLGEANLQGANLGTASIQKATLAKANLQGADLTHADLQKADLTGANLQGVSLWEANLQEANLWEANLQKADAQGANLRGVSLWKAHLQGANLWEANLQEANLEHAHFDEDTILPDESNWMPGIDIARFTNPGHPEFWRSDDPSSPAYRGKPEND